MNDYISRQAAIDAIENEQMKIMSSDWAIDQAKFSGMSTILELLKDLPSVSAEYIAHEVWKSGYVNGYNKSQKEAYEKGKEVGKEEMYRQMTGTLA